METVEWINGMQVQEANHCAQARKQTITTKSKLAGVLYHYFASVCQSLPSASYQGPVKTSAKFHFATIEEVEVLKLVSTLDVDKATGHDKISARVLKTVAPAISGSLTFLFNESLRTGQFPSEWKFANVTPVPKAGDCQIVSNYLPVSFLPVIAQVFERLNLYTRNFSSALQQTSC